MSARLQVLLAAVCFGTTGTAQALGPAASPVGVGAARIVVGGAILVLIARSLRAALPRRGRDGSSGHRGRRLRLPTQLSSPAVNLTGVAVGTVVAIGAGPAAAGAARADRQRRAGSPAAGRSRRRAPRRRRPARRRAAARPSPRPGSRSSIIAGLGYATCTRLSKRLIAAGTRPSRRDGGRVRRRGRAAPPGPRDRRPGFAHERGRRSPSLFTSASSRPRSRTSCSPRPAVADAARPRRSSSPSR